MLKLKPNTLPDLFLRSYGYIFFSNSPTLGAMVFLLTCLHPSAGLHSVVAFLAAFLFGELTGFSRKDMLQGLFLYNPILIGVALGHLYIPSPVSLGLTVLLSLLTFAVSASLNASLSHFFRLPILNVPFAIIAVVLYLARFRYRSLGTFSMSSFEQLQLTFLPDFLSSLFRSLGVLIFLPYDWVGMIMLLLFALYSRIHLFLIVAGYAVGIGTLTLLNLSYAEALANPYSFNFILISMALGGFFLIPSKRTYLIAFLSVMLSTVLMEAGSVAFSLFQIPLFTLPFALTVLLVLHTLKIGTFPYVAEVFAQTPEATLEHWHNFRLRFLANLPAPRLPFLGEWTVYQGFDDEWTHQGIWKHGVDFVIEDGVSGKTFSSDGNYPEDYFCWRKPVLSPVDGYVTALENSLPDNPIGVVDRDNNWGNYIIILSDFGYYVEISHFYRGSISIQVGERVTAGQKIGLCGNSGYSPQPHIHMQVQKQGLVGSATIPFSFSDALQNTRFVKCLESPTKGDRYSTLEKSAKLYHRFLFILDEEYHYELFRNDLSLGHFHCQVKMDRTGAYCLEETQRGSRLYFLLQEGCFSFTSLLGDERSFLRLLFLGVPSLPLTERPIHWEETLRSSLLRGHSCFSSFLKSFHHPLYTLKGDYRSDGRGIVEGDLTLQGQLSKKRVRLKTILDPVKGIESVHLNTVEGEYVLKRV